MKPTLGPKPIHHVTTIDDFEQFLSAFIDQIAEFDSKCIRMWTCLSGWNVYFKSATEKFDTAGWKSARRLYIGWEDIWSTFAAIIQRIGIIRFSVDNFSGIGLVSSCWVSGFLFFVADFTRQTIFCNFFLFKSQSFFKNKIEYNRSNDYFQFIQQNN